MSQSKEILRWSASCAIVLTCYGAAATAIYAWEPTFEPQAAPMTLALIDLAPVVAPPPPSPPEPKEQKPPEPEPIPEPEPEPEVEKIEPPPDVHVEVPLPPKRKPKPPEIKRIEAPPPAPTPPAPTPVRDIPPPAAPRTQVAVAPTPSPNVFANYLAELVAHVQKNLRYPRNAQIRGEQGTAYILILVERGGTVLRHRLDRSSSRHTLDQEAVAVIERAAPLPPFPRDLTETQLELRLPVQFRLR